MDYKDFVSAEDTCPECKEGELQPVIMVNRATGDVTELDQDQCNECSYVSYYEDHSEHVLCDELSCVL